ncbi:unknown [Clostridium sp. CAG:590]|nr:unknown [Clostridium sp. CAG:590]
MLYDYIKQHYKEAEPIFFQSWEEGTSQSRY